MWCKALALIHIRWWSPSSKDTRGAYENSPQMRLAHLNRSRQLAGLDALTPSWKVIKGELVEGVFEDSCRCSRIHVKAVRDSMSITTYDYE